MIFIVYSLHLLIDWFLSDKMAPLTVTRAHVWCIAQIQYIWYCGWCRIVQGIKQPCGKWPTSASPPLRSGCFSIIIRLDFDWHDTFLSRTTLLGTKQLLIKVFAWPKHMNVGNALVSHTYILNTLKGVCSLGLSRCFHIADMESWLQGPLSGETKPAKGQKSKRKRRVKRVRGRWGRVREIKSAGVCTETNQPWLPGKLF